MSPDFGVVEFSGRRIALSLPFYVNKLRKQSILLLTLKAVPYLAVAQKQ